MLSGIAGAYWWINNKLEGAPRVDLSLDEGSANFLILGSDSRAFVSTEQDAASFGEVGGERADTLIIVRIDPETRRALMVSLPRDLWVEIPGKGGSKINAAFQDGPQGVIEAIRTNFNIPIHHYVQVDFAGFRNIVDAMGGVEIYSAAPARDPKTGLNVPEAGCTTLDGDQALALVRSRHYQYFESGVWRTDPSGDFGRINRQQDFIRRLIAQSLDSGFGNPARGNDLINKGLKNVTLDSALSTGDVFKLVRVFRSGDPNDVEMAKLPADVGRKGAQSVVLLREAEAAALFARLRGEGSIGGDVAPSSVKVRVLNGTGGSGVATRTSRQLADAGFLPAGAGDAERFGYSQTEIHYRPGEQNKAELLKQYLGGRGKLVEDTTIGIDADLVVVVGSDFTGVSVPVEESLGLPMEPVVSVRSGGPSQGQTEEPEPAGEDPSPEC